jgi:hypothetical protein
MSDADSGQMSAHAAECESCARAAESERKLRSAWRELPSLGETPDIWPQLAARISVPREIAPVRPAWLAWLPDAKSSLRYGFAGVGAAVVLGVLLMNRPAPMIGTREDVYQPSVASTETKTIQLVSDRQALLPEADGDLAIMATPRYRAAERVVLGVGERR